MGKGTLAALAAAALAAALLPACAKDEEGTSAGRHWSTTNPSTFPLYHQSAVIAVVPVDSSQLFATIRRNQPNSEIPRNYRGHEIIAQTDATMGQLRGWMNSLKSAPPNGFHVSSNHDLNVGENNNRDFTKNAAVGVQFDTSGAGRTVYVVVADPKKIREEMGPAFALIESYGQVPSMLRGPIDDQAKKQLGYSVTEMLDPNSPVGAVVTAVKQLESSNHRAILLIDESRS